MEGELHPIIVMNINKFQSCNVYLYKRQYSRVFNVWSPNYEGIVNKLEEKLFFRVPLN